jgi:hypothetical protein
MAATDAHKIAKAEWVASQGASLSLHSADPGTTGANELSGGGYARKTTTWGAGAMGSGGDAGKGKVVGSAQTFDVEAGDTAAWLGVWGAGPTFRWGKALEPGVTITAGGANGKVEVTPNILEGDPV